jgi:hypothetical protein
MATAEMVIKGLDVAVAVALTAVGMVKQNQVVLVALGVLIDLDLVVGRVAILPERLELLAAAAGALLVLVPLGVEVLNPYGPTI